MGIEIYSLSEKSSKSIYDKDKLAKIKFTKKVTVNNLSQKSFVQEFLQSIKTKMYGNRWLIVNEQSLLIKVEQQYL